MEQNQNEECTHPGCAHCTGWHNCRHNPDVWTKAARPTPPETPAPEAAGQARQRGEADTAYHLEQLTTAVAALKEVEGPTSLAIAAHDACLYLANRVEALAAGFHAAQAVAESAFQDAVAAREAHAAEVARLRREIDALRHFGNKDCTAYADEALREERGER